MRIRLGEEDMQTDSCGIQTGPNMLAIRSWVGSDPLLHLSGRLFRGRHVLLGTYYIS